MCENQPTQCRFSDHWKSSKTLFLKKIITGDAKETKRLTEVWTKDFTSYKIRYVFKKKKVK